MYNIVVQKTKKLMVRCHKLGGSDFIYGCCQAGGPHPSLSREVSTFSAFIQHPKFCFLIGGMDLNELIFLNRHLGYL